MGRLFKSNTYLEDNKINAQIEQLLDNRLFQKLIEKTDVLADENFSMSQSLIGSKAKVLESALMVENPSFMKSDFEKIRQWTTANGSDKLTEGTSKAVEKPKLMLLDNLGNFEMLKDKKKTEGEIDRQPNMLKSIPLAEIKQEKAKGVFQKNTQSSLENFISQMRNKDKKEGKLVPNKIGGNANISNEESRLTFTDRRKQQADSGSDKLLGDLSSKMRNDLSQTPSEIEEADMTLNDTMCQHIDMCLDFQSVVDLPDDDQGFMTVAVNRNDLNANVQEIEEKFALKSVMVSNITPKPNNYSKSLTQTPCNLQSDKNHFLPDDVIYPSSKDSFYPKRCSNTIYDVMQMKVVFDRERTGFEETKEFPIIIGSMIAGRYKVTEFLGSAAFSKVVHAVDVVTQGHYCLKIIENNKDYFDQSLDEIKILRYINANGDCDEHNILKLHDFFYYTEHLILVTELLKDNLYEYYRFNLETESVPFFDVNRLKPVSWQMLTALNFIHEKKVIHCDVKPENIMIKSYSRSLFKLIDFGSACFVHDHLSSYVQSRFYRAPEIILGCHYDYKIDIWALGCVLVELFTGRVLFQANSMSAIIARIINIIGPLPKWMLKKGKQIDKYFVNEYVLIESGSSENEPEHAAEELSERLREDDFDKVNVLIPRRGSLKNIVRTDESLFLDFLQRLLKIDPNMRPSAKEALGHPWFRATN